MERMNRVLEDMLRNYVSPQQNDWDTHLASAEFAIDNSFQESIKNTPFRLNNGRDPKTPLSWGLHVPSKVPAVKEFIKTLQESLREAKSSLEAAQQRQRHFADKKRREADFCIGDKVLLNSKNVKNRMPGTPKLMPKWIGPLKVIEKINPVAYRLELPPNLRMHNVFHGFFYAKVQERRAYTTSSTLFLGGRAGIYPRGKEWCLTVCVWSPQNVPLSTCPNSKSLLRNT
jgi:hypothetical protein